MMRLLLALLAVLTGLATCGAPTLASVQAESGPVSIAPQEDQVAGRVFRAARAASPGDAARHQAIFAPIVAVRASGVRAASVLLQVDRAHE